VVVDKTDLDLLYETMARICLSSKFMSDEDQSKISYLMEEIIKIFKSYEETE